MLYFEYYADELDVLRVTRLSVKSTRQKIGEMLQCTVNLEGSGEKWLIYHHHHHHHHHEHDHNHVACRALGLVTCCGLINCLEVFLKGRPWFRLVDLWHVSDTVAVCRKCKDFREVKEQRIRENHLIWNFIHRILRSTYLA
jgi:hypothetical protein